MKQTYATKKVTEAEFDVLKQTYIGQRLEIGRGDKRDYYLDVTDIEVAQDRSTQYVIFAGSVIQLVNFSRLTTKTAFVVCEDGHIRYKPDTSLKSITPLVFDILKQVQTEEVVIEF